MAGNHFTARINEVDYHLEYRKNSHTLEPSYEVYLEGKGPYSWRNIGAIAKVGNLFKVCAKNPLMEALARLRGIDPFKCKPNLVGTCKSRKEAGQLLAKVGVVRAHEFLRSPVIPINLETQYWETHQKWVRHAVVLDEMEDRALLIYQYKKQDPRTLLVGDKDLLEEVLASFKYLTHTKPFTRVMDMEVAAKALERYIGDIDAQRILASID